jgi:hypothetical protein
LLCAVTYVSGEPDIVGWFVGANRSYPSAFSGQNFFSAEQKHFWATAGSDIYGGWRYDYARGDSERRTGRSTMPCTTLDRLEDVFVAEWLVFKGDLRFDVEAEGPAWTFYSHGFNDEALRYLIALALDHYNRSVAPGGWGGARAGHRPSLRADQHGLRQMCPSIAFSSTALSGRFRSGSTVSTRERGVPVPADRRAGSAVPDPGRSRSRLHAFPTATHPT